MGLSLGTWMLITVMIAFSGSAILMWFAARNNGQFEDVEGIKYRMLEDGEYDIPPSQLKE
ncbi:cbb3-type cytochrome oxidase assembly protein [Aneurinibacillus terranovensis]|uniref:cbb3-type cytochrome oxidase assembly protein n=1 Tax=Aneurinibacillus terranovensis TaxID=278991 RepID=UPI00138ACE2A